MKKILFAVCLFVLAVACSNQEQNNSNHGDASVQESQSDEKWFGETFEINNIQNIGAVVNGLDSLEEMEAVVKAKVGEVCQVKGCWMNVSDEGGNELFVQFKDYGFFMPKDLTGQEVIMKGKAYREITSVEDLRHFAEDEGLSAEEIAAITEPEEELKFMASGVKIVH